MNMNIPAKFTITTANQSQQIDAETSDNFGIDGFTLMEIAGTSAAHWLNEKLEPGSRGVFLCGKGNNGGDALVIARFLVQHGISTEIVFISGTDDLSPAAQKNYELLQQIDANDAEAGLQVVDGWNDFDQTNETDFIIDGMLGTGLDSDLRGDYVDAVKWTNDASSSIFAIDIPTGLHANSGKIMGDAINADHTFSFGTQKLGFFLGKGHQLSGNVHCFELPFPRYIINQQSTTYLMDESWLPKRNRGPARHKYEAGVVYIIAGSEGLTGAAMMAAKSAWAEGVGAVILVCPRGALPIFENNLPQIIKKPVGTRDDFYFTEEHQQEIKDIVSEKDGPVLIGPGLGREDTTINFVTEFLAQTEKSVIIDADALWAVSQQQNWEKPENASWVLTPHPGELSRLLDKNIDDDSERLDEVKRLAQEKKITLLSKGFPVILGTANDKTYISGYDTRIFSRAGFGDTLAGKIAAYDAMGYTEAESCIKALLIGREKALNHKNNLEPFDLI